MDGLLLPLGFLVFLGGLYAMFYNGLIHARQKVEEAWSGIDVQLKRRYDLIPNLVNTVKGYASHEKQTLENITNARATAMSVPDAETAKKAAAEGALSGALRSLFALSENYPDLKANANFLELQQQLAETEDQIASSRRIYNGNVTAYNVKVQSVPSNIVANIHHFSEREFFEIPEGDREKTRETPEVSF
ncbi:LemA family protein [Candidatus Peregrinibacteria bacterium]|nr:MAG: LemA family protein [Candidatus Peregrinibacteria bacterium]